MLLNTMSTFQKKIEKTEKGVWRYAELYDKFVKPENRLSLNGVSTREVEIESINRLLDMSHLYLKREDKNPTGSIKDRSLAYQVSLAKQNGLKELIISTSGNAGISAAAYCQKAGIKIYIFISPKTEEAKIAEMQKYNPIVIESTRAIRLANYLSAKYKIKNLRPSINDDSIEGFKSIAFEIFENLGEIDALFTFVTSGSSFVGIGRAFEYLLESGEIKRMPKLFAVQSGNIFSIAREFDNINYEKKNCDSAGKLGVKNTRRKNEIMKLINLSKGGGLYFTTDEIRRAENILRNNGIFTSSEGCASFAGALRVGKKSKFEKTVCVFSGKERDRVDRIYRSKIYKAENFKEVGKIVKSNF